MQELRTPRFKDKVCLVTGGYSGIGLATSERFAAEGGKVLVVGRTRDKGERAVNAIRAAGGQAAFAEADVGVPAQIRAAVQAALDAWGKVDVLVNSAAIMTFEPVVDLDEAAWDQLMAVNLRAVFLFCKHALPHMSGGAIVNVSSVHAFQTTANVAPYAASKGGMEAFTRALSIEAAARQVRVNSVAPGAVDTPMLWDNPNVKSGKEQVGGQVGQPADIAAAIAFLASDEARFITGATLVADGGRLDQL